MIEKEGSPRKRKGATKSPWLTTAFDVMNVIDVNEKTGEVTVGGKPLTENQAVTLKSEAQIFLKFTLLPLVLDTTRKKAVDIGINKATNFDHTLTAKGMLLTVDWFKGLLDLFAKLNLPNINKQK